MLFVLSSFSLLACILQYLVLHPTPLLVLPKAFLLSLFPGFLNIVVDSLVSDLLYHEV